LTENSLFQNPKPGAIPPPPGQAMQHNKKQNVDPEMFDKVAKGVNSMAANLRILEERYSLMRSKSQMTEQNMITLEKNANKDFKTLSDEIIEIKHTINDLTDKLRLISEELRNLVDKNEFKVLERYMDLWQPMNFVTRNELTRMLEEKRNQEKKEPINSVEKQQPQSNTHKKP
jgi:predicted  nucleic acid-binding Zn-ribbon protein